MLLGWVLRWGEDYGQEEVDKGAVDLRDQLAVVLGQELLVVCQELLGPVSGEMELCLPLEGVSAHSFLFLMFHASLPEDKKEMTM